MTTVIYRGGLPWEYYLIDPLFNEECKVTEKEFYDIVGTDRKLVTMKYAEGNVNRQNFFLDDILLGFRVR